LRSVMDFVIRSAEARHIRGRRLLD
jgi:hypothetical protein